jgi:PPP family 3-phenylpropionic acid transporter
MYAAVAALFPFFPLLLQSKGLNNSQIGYLLGSYELISIIGLMTIGFIYDKYRSPRFTIILLSSISLSILYFVSRSESMRPLIILVLFLGFFIKSPASLLDALYGQTIRNPQESYGKVRLGGSLGFLVTALLINFTQWIKGSNPSSIFTGYFIFMIIVLGSSFFLPTQYIHTREKKVQHIGFIKSLKSFPSIFWIGLTIAFLSSLSLSGHITFFSLLLKNRFFTENVSGFWAIGAVFEIPLFFFSGFLFKKFKLRTLWIICLVAGITRMQVYSITQSLLPLYLVQVLNSLSFGLNHLSMINLISRTTSAESRGLAMSLLTAIGMGLSMFTGGFLGGLILQQSGFPLLFQVFSIFPLIAIVIAIIFLKEIPAEKTI